MFSKIKCCFKIFFSKFRDLLLASNFRPYAEHVGPPPRNELIQFSQLFLVAPGLETQTADKDVSSSSGAAGALVRVIWDALSPADPESACLETECRHVTQCIIGVKLLNCLARAWFASESGPGLPDWLGTYIPRLIAQIVCSEAGCAEGQPGARVHGLLSCAALELGIEILSVEHYRRPLQRAFFAILAHRTAAPEFFEQLRRRMIRAELEDAALSALYKEMMQSKPGKGAWASLPEFLFLDRAGCKRSLALHELAASARRDDAHALADEEVCSNHVELVLGFTQVIRALMSTILLKLLGLLKLNFLLNHQYCYTGTL